MKKDRFPCDDVHRPKKSLIEDLKNQCFALQDIFRQMDLDFNKNKPTEHDPMFGDTKKKK